VCESWLQKAFCRERTELWVIVGYMMLCRKRPELWVTVGYKAVDRQILELWVTVVYMKLCVEIGLNSV